MSDEDERAGTVALLERLAEAKALVDETSRLAEELKLREERLRDLLAPSETALQARTEYLDKVLREQLGRAELRVMQVAEEVNRLSRSLSDQVAQLPSRIAEMDARREQARRSRDRWRLAVMAVLLLIGGFLAGELAMRHARVPDAVTDVKADASESQAPGSVAQKPAHRPAPKTVHQPER